MIPEQVRKNLKIQIKEKLSEIYLAEDFKEKLGIKNKADKSLVTEIDIFISNLFKNTIKDLPNLKDHIFFSEEDHDKFSFPCVILDPIDGTRELVRGIPECAISVGILNSPTISDGWGWIFNPFTGLDISSDDDFLGADFGKEQKISGAVSRSEWNKGLYNDFDLNDYLIFPRGSIAFKLGLLAVGSYDFVVTKRPKNIWDIAGGSILCSQRGIYFYQNGKKIKKIHDHSKMDSCLYWCKEKYADKIKNLIS